MLATVSATIQTFRISQREFPYIHGQHNRANAFRHALWNILIAKNSARFSKNQDSVLRWTKNITDWHEEFSPNEPLPKAMDLHNNQIGRDIYVEHLDSKTDELVHFMKDQLNLAMKIHTVSEAEKYSKQMVYLED